MLRYFALSTVIVALVLAAILALPHVARDARQSLYRSSAQATPGPATRGDRDSGSRDVAVRGDAPWALSALPGCFHQEHFAAGDEVFVHAKMPRDARRVAAGLTLSTADCRLRVGRNDATVARGDNVLHIPPPARLYVAGERLLLETRTGSRLMLRTYAIVAGGAPRFTMK